MKRLLFLVLFLLAACNRDEASRELSSTGNAPTGDVQRGRMLISQYGCNVCHAIPGIDGPRGSLGPALAGLAGRPTISAARVQNTPANLAQFIQSPASLNPKTSMPPMSMTPADAQDITAFLLTLR